MDRRVHEEAAVRPSDRSQGGCGLCVGGEAHTHHHAGEPKPWRMAIERSTQPSQPLRFSRYGVGDMRRKSYTFRAHGHGIANLVVRFPSTPGSRSRRGSRSVRVRHWSR